MNKTRMLVAAAIMGVSSAASAGYYINTDSLTYSGSVTYWNGTSTVTNAMGNRNTTLESASVRDLALNIGRDVPSGVVTQFGLDGVRSSAAAANPLQFLTAWYYTSAYNPGAPAGTTQVASSSAQNPNYINNGYFQIDDLLRVVNSLGGTGGWDASRTHLVFNATAAGGGLAWNGNAATGDFTGAGMGGNFVGFSISGDLGFGQAASLRAGSTDWYEIDALNPGVTNPFPTSVAVTVSAQFVNDSGTAYSYNLTLGGDANSWVTNMSSRATVGYNDVYGVYAPYYGGTLLSAGSGGGAGGGAGGGGAAVPVPATLGLLGLGLVGLGAIRRKRA